MKALEDIPLHDRRLIFNDHNTGTKDNRLPFELSFQNPAGIFDAPYSIYTLDRQEKYIMGIHQPCLSVHPTEREVEYMRCAQQNFSMSRDYSGESGMMFSNRTAGQFPGMFPQLPCQSDGKQQMVYEQMMRCQVGPMMNLPDQLQLQAMYQQTHIPPDRYDLLPFYVIQVLRSMVYSKKGIEVRAQICAQYFVNESYQETALRILEAKNSKICNFCTGL